MRNRGSEVEDKIEYEIMYPIMYRDHLRVFVLIGNKIQKATKCVTRNLPQAVRNSIGKLIGSASDETYQEQ